MKTIQGRQREALWEDFCDFLTKDAFNRILDAYTESNEVLVVNTCPDTTITPESMLMWWKAADPGPFKMGSKEYQGEKMSLGGEEGVPGREVLKYSSFINMDTVSYEPYKSMRGPNHL